jgi:hypothetical protein
MATPLEEKRSLLDTAHRLGAIKAHTYSDCLRRIARLSLADCRELAKPVTQALSHAGLPAPGGAGERQMLASMPVGNMPVEDELSMHSRLIGAMQRVRTYMGRRNAVNDKSRAMEVSQALTAACSALDMLCDELGRAPCNLGLSTTIELTASEAQALHAANTVGGLHITPGQIAAARGRGPVTSAPQSAAKVVELSASAPAELTKHELSALRAAQSVGLRTTAADMLAARGKRIRS